jgi:hypothetical protein
MLSLIAAALLSTVPARPLDCEVVRRIGRLAALPAQDAGLESAVLTITEAVVDRGCGFAGDYIVRAEEAAKAGDSAEEARWLGAAIERARDVNQLPMNLHFLRARALLALGCDEEARREATLGLTHPTVANLMSFDVPRSAWRENAPEVADVLRRIAEGFPEGDGWGIELRRVASMLRLKHGFYASYYTGDRETIDAFASADLILPLEQQPVEVQLSVWQALAVAHAALREFPHAVAALEQLYALCYPADGPDRCPRYGVVDVNLSPPELEKMREANRFLADRGYPALRMPGYSVDGENLRVLSFVLDAALESISWEDGRRRDSARDEDFIGVHTDDGPYAGDVSAEEDRVETETQWLAYSDGLQPEFADDIFERAKTRSEPLIKVYLTELHSDPGISILNTRSLIAFNLFLGRPFAEVEQELEARRNAGLIADPTWTAFETGRSGQRLLRMLFERRVKGDPVNRPK